jgi:hypothetical protein
MTRLRISVALVIVGLFASVALSGQGSWSMTQWFQHTISTQAARLDLVKSAQAGVDPNMRVYIDQAWTYRDQVAPWETHLFVDGWGFECGEANLAAVDLRLNGFVLDATAFVHRHLRADVNADPGLSGWCQNIPVQAGLTLDVPVSILPGGYYVRLRTWNDRGESYESNSMWVWIQ